MISLYDSNDCCILFHLYAPNALCDTCSKWGKNESVFVCNSSVSNYEWYLLLVDRFWLIIVLLNRNLTGKHINNTNLPLMSCICMFRRTACNWQTSNTIVSDVQFKVEKKTSLHFRENLEDKYYRLNLSHLIGSVAVISLWPLQFFAILFCSGKKLMYSLAMYCYMWW